MGYLCCWSLYSSYQRFNQSPVQSMEPLNELKSHHPTTQAQMQKHIVYPDPTTFQLFNQHTLVLLASFPWALYCIHSIKHMKEDKSNKRACFCIGWSLQSIHLSFIGFTELVVSSKQPVTSGTRTAASQATSQSPCGRGFRDGLLWAEGVGGVQCPWPSISGLWSFPHSFPERHQMRHSWARTDPVHAML